MWKDCHFLFAGALSTQLVLGKNSITSVELLEEATPWWMKDTVLTKPTLYAHLREFEKEGVLIRKGDRFLIDTEVLGIKYGVSPKRFEVSEWMDSKTIHEKICEIGDASNEIMQEFRKRMRQGKYVPDSYYIHIDFKPRLIKLDKSKSMHYGSPKKLTPAQKKIWKRGKEITEEQEEKRIQRLLKKLNKSR